MSSCAVRRWGPGTCKEKEPDTVASKELSSKLEQMKQLRANDSKLWTQLKPASTQNPNINGKY